MDNRQVGKFIAQLRKSKGMTQKELAEKLGITDKAVSKWERGLGYPDISILPSLADIFEVTLEEILSGVQASQMIEDTVNQTGFFKKRHVKVIVFVQVILSAIIGLTAAVSILYAGYMGDAIWETLKGLLAVWLMVACIFGFIPLLSCYLWDSLSSTGETKR